MRKTWLVTVREMQASLQRRAYLFFAFILPLLFGLVALAIVICNRETAAAPTPAPAEAVQRGIVRPDGGLPPTLDSWGEELLDPFPDEVAAGAALAEGTIDGYYLVAADYVQSGDVLYVTQRYNPLADDAGSRPLEQLLLTDLLDDGPLASLVTTPLIVTERPLDVADTPEGETCVNFRT